MKFQFSLYLVSIVLVHDNFSHVIIAVKARAIHDEKEYTLFILSSAIMQHDFLLKFKIFSDNQEEKLSGANGPIVRYVFYPCS